MPRKKIYRKGVCAVIFRKTRSGSFFLVFHRLRNWTGWELLKAGVKPGEDTEKALARELREETSLRKFKVIAKVPKKIKYRWPNWLLKDRRLYKGSEEQVYLVEVFDKDVKIDKTEHDDYKWLRSDAVLKYLTHRNQKKVFKYVVEKYKNKF